MQISGIQAGMMEAAGNGALSHVGKIIDFRDNTGTLVTRWYAATSKDAAQQVRMFRAAPKHIKVAA